MADFGDPRPLETRGQAISEDAEKIDDVRAALRQGDLSKASQLGRVFRLMPIGT